MADELIFESKNSKVIRSDESEWGFPVVTKLLNQEFPSPQNIRHFYNEYEITKGLDIPGVRKVLRMGKVQNRHALIFQYVPGIPVKKLVQEGPMAIADFLRFGIAIARILGDIHRLNIIHKDVNSQNIVLDRDSWTVTLLDFGISTQLDLKEQHLGNPERLEGSLSYISPEQTGRMNRVVDYRTDLYSLGVTFYEMLTGQLPFVRNDAMELVHAHLAQKPRAVHGLRPEAPKVLSDIIDRLLAKNAEDRYQSAHGLMRDLQHCLDAWERQGAIADFPLGKKDFSGKFQIPQKLYGRDEELRLLMESFDRVAQGALETVLVGGYSGTGKSALVHETHRPITARRGYFIEGKFDQFQRSLPYFAFIEAFRGFVALLLTENEERLQPLQERIRRAVGTEGKVLTDVLPSLELLIGPQPEVPEVGGAEAQNRFNYTFRRFVQAISGPDHPIVLFIDDLQWADAASLSLLQVLMTDTDTRHLLCICAYRDNEVSASHPFVTTVAEMDQKKATIHRIGIGNLTRSDVHSLLSDATALAPERTESLARLVFEKTLGNAFFVTQFIRSLAREGLLHFDFEKHCWDWDVEEIRARNITDNVVELLAGKVSELPQKTRQILKVAACIGSQFDLDMLAACAGSLVDLETAGLEESENILDRELRAALAEGFVTPAEDRYRFVHDRIQQAVYSLIPAGERGPLHLRIGELLLEKIPAEQQENHLFDIVNQYNQGLELVTAPEKRALLAELNLRAGRKAKLSSAFKPAYEYLETGIGLLQPDHWKTQYELSLQLFTEGAETAYNMGDFEPMAEKLDTVLQHSRDLLDTIRPYAIRINAYKAQNKLQEAIDTGLEVLARLGETFPKKGALPLVMADLLKTKWMLRGKDVQTLTNLPAMQNPQKEAALRMLNDIASPVYWARPGILPFLIFRMVQLSLRYGNTAISAFGFATYGLLMCGVVGDMKSGYQFGQIGLALLDRFKAKEWLSQIYTPVYALINHWSEHVHKSLEPFLYSYRVGFETGAIEYACINVNIYCNHIYLGGKPLVKAEEEMRAFSQRMKEYKQETNFNYNEAYRQAVLNLLGQSDDPTQLIGTAYDSVKMAEQNRERQDRAGTFLIHFHGMILNYLFQNYEAAQRHSEQTRPLLDAVLAKYDVSVFWFYEALVAMALARERSGRARWKLMRRAGKNIAQFRKWARFCPENHSHKLSLLLAEQAWYKGRADAARKHYDRAIAGAGEQEFLNEEALSNERAGLFYQSTEQAFIAEHFFRKAFQTYREWGAQAKLEDMQLRYPQFLTALPREKGQLSGNTTTLETTSLSSDSMLDLDTVMKAAQVISGEIVFQRLLRTLLRITIENAGAETGSLIMENNGQWQIEATGAFETEQGDAGQPLALLGNGIVPESIVQYAIRTRESLVLDDVQRDDRFSGDPVVQSRGLHSVLCLPILNKGDLKGILYLENNLQGGVFTENRIQFLSLLSGQIAVSLENSKLYENLEQKVVERTEEIARQRDLIEAEKHKSDRLLLNILPAETAEELKRLGAAKPRRYDSVTVLFTDFVNFSVAAGQMSAEELVQEIHKYYSAFDDILTRHNLEKIKTIGDSYMCAGGLPVENQTHAVDAVRAALEMQAFVGQESAERQQAGLPWFDCRIGIHTGPVVAGIVGTKKFAYDIWGSTVNIASRMESSGAPGKVNISQATYSLVRDHFRCTNRGKIETKNTGLVEMYFVEE